MTEEHEILCKSIVCGIENCEYSILISDSHYWSAEKPHYNICILLDSGRLNIIIKHHNKQYNKRLDVCDFNELLLVDSIKTMEESLLKAIK